MSDASAHIARLDRSIARTGETIMLRRLITDTNGIEQIETEITPPAHVRASRPQDLVSGDDVADIAVIVSATGLGAFGVPARDDRIEIQGRACNIQKISPVYIGADLVRVNLLCRGGDG